MTTALIEYTSKSKWTSWSANGLNGAGEVLFLTGRWQNIKKAEELITLFSAPGFAQVTWLELSDSLIKAFIKLSEQVLRALPAHVTVLDFSFDYTKTKMDMSGRAFRTQEHFLPDPAWFPSSLKTIIISCKLQYLDQTAFKNLLNFLRKLPLHIEEVNFFNNDDIRHRDCDEQPSIRHDIGRNLTQTAILSTIPSHIKRCGYGNGHEVRPHFLSAPDKIGYLCDSEHSILLFERMIGSSKNHYKPAILLVLIVMRHNQRFKKFNGALIGLIASFVGGENYGWNVTQKSDPSQQKTTQSNEEFHQITNEWHDYQRKQAFHFLSSERFFGLKNRSGNPTELGEKRHFLGCS